MNKYKIIAICGKSAAGKDTLLQEIIQQYPDLHEIISCTTRPPRDYEVNGASYFFLSEEQFFNKVLNGEMLETSKFRDWYYGTSVEGCSTEKINVGVFNPDGIRNLSANNNIDLYVVLVQASDKVRLLRSLHREHHPDVDEIVRRYLTDKEDFELLSQIYEPDYIFDTTSSFGMDKEWTARQIVQSAHCHWAEQAN